MSSWYSSWLPGLPTISLALPSSIQRRFIFFALKKSLGHLLRPGQLDVHQIDSQIGSGYIQVRDLELNNESINAALAGLPIELYDGSVAAVTARIPWPNPLTTTVGISLESLHLTFHVLPKSTRTPSTCTPPSNVNLAESVISVAESFMHDELTDREETTLRESFHQDLASSSHTTDDDGQNVPGSLDPFLSAPENDDINVDVDPVGISMFSALIERLLARFEFGATDTMITLVHPGNASFTLSVPEIRYGTETNGPRNTDITESGDKPDNIHQGETRTLSISSVSISSRDLRPLADTSAPSPLAMSMVSAISVADDNHASQSGSPPASPSSSSSSLDEDTQFLMSQSLAFLPPRPASPTSSVASSLYQSALSDAPALYDSLGNPKESRSRSSTPSPGAQTIIAEGPNQISEPLKRKTSIYHPSSQNETVLSFGAEGIIIKLTTPSVHIPAPPSPDGARGSGSEKLQFSVSIGIIACAIRAYHVRQILDLADAWVAAASSSDIRKSPSMSNPSKLIWSLGLQVDMKLRGVVILLLSSQTGQRLRESDDSLATLAFFTRPVIPPRLSYGYTRLHIESVILSAALGNSSSSKASTADTNATTFSLTIPDLSVFVFQGATNANGGLSSSPVLITDIHLPSQYPPMHLHPNQNVTESPTRLPTFEVIDWTDTKLRENGSRLSLWRNKHRQWKSEHIRRDSPTNHDHTSSTIANADVSANTPPSAVVLKASTTSHLEKGKATVTQRLDVEMVPLHLFLDLKQILCGELLPFLNEVTESKPSLRTETVLNSESTDDKTVDGSEDEGDTPPATPYARTTGDVEIERAKERRRLEQLVLSDLDLELDYREKAPVAKGLPPKRRKGKENTLTITIKIPMIRVQVRGPPPLSQKYRSGALILDLHSVLLSIGSLGNKPELRFVDPDTSVIAESNGNILMAVDCGRIVVASSLCGKNKASTILSIGPLNSEFDQVDSPQAPPLRPRLTLIKPNYHHRSATHNSRQAHVLNVTVPSLHVSLGKDLLDSLQYWADDVTQIMERTFGASGETDTEKADSSRDTSMIGSRFFARSRRSDSEQSGTESKPAGEIVLKVLIAEAYVQLILPREKELSISPRPFNVLASDVDLLIELKPEGKDMTVLTLGIMELSILDTSPSGDVLSFLSLTAPRSLVSTPKPLIKLRFKSLIVPETTAKESRIKLVVWGFTYNLYPDLSWVTDLAQFFKSPPGAFESVIPSESTRISLNILDGSVRVLAPNHLGAVLLYLGDLEFSTAIVGDSPEALYALALRDLSLLGIDDLSSILVPDKPHISGGVPYWKGIGFALIAEVTDLELNLQSINGLEYADARLTINRIALRLHLCADTLSAIIALVGDISSTFKPPPEERPPPVTRGPTMITTQPKSKDNIMSSVDENIFRRVPDVGPAPDMIYDDLPTNLDYLDESFGTAAGLRELRDDDLDEFDLEEEAESSRATFIAGPQVGVVSKVGGETIRMVHPDGLNTVPNYFDTLSPDAANLAPELGATTLRVRVHKGDITLFLYDGYDWAKTRKTIEDEIKEMRRRLAKIRQLVASGQTQDPSIEETSALLFNSVYIGLEQDVDELEPGELLAAIDEELKDDVETTSQSSWQSLKPVQSAPKTRSTRVHGKRLTRSKGPSIEFRLAGLDAEVDQYRPHEPLVSRLLASVRDLEILDHIKTSTWNKFLTELRSDSRGNVRETDSNMVRVELRSVRPVPSHPSVEARLRAKILPLRLYVDQDALDFLKKFFSFKDPYAAPPAASDSDDGDIYFQSAEIFPIDIKLDYKPRRVDYRALREGKTIELMNFFHFDGAEMTLRHITLSGITGWPRLFDMLNDLWTPDVKATQLVEVISGVAPIRSFVNVGSGVADLVLLPIAQYKKDGRIVRGVQKGTTSFVKTTATEAIKLGARLATGTQVILEQAEGVLGGQFKTPITTETVQLLSDDFTFGESNGDDDGEGAELISKYAEQPTDIKEGMQSAYKSLQRNFSSAAQTILAVPMEVYERSGNEGPVRAVIRAVPIAVLKPMIGASEAVSKTLLGLHNSLDPNVRHENEAKYKQR